MIEKHVETPTLTTTIEMPETPEPSGETPEPSTDWYKDAIIYELHVRAFADSDADGIGDFRGLTSKLDYLRDLGVTAIWLLPFSPSPLRDDGYDTANYTAIHAMYGSMQDFKAFLRQAHQRGLKVITELVLNHTSDQHPWFQRARQSPPGSKWRNFYVWSDTTDKYTEARIIFKDFEHSNWTWDREANAYYWHRFYSHQPDLNYASPHVRRAMLQVVDFWLKLGVDGLRLDAVPYLYEHEGTNCENLPQTHAFLQELRAYIDSKYEGRMLLAEANQWPEDAVTYFGDGNECHMAFHFPVMPRLFMALRMEDRFPIIEIMQQTPDIPTNCQWAVFLRNHDELTLEMVTDEDRDYMYRVYAQDPKARINLGIRRRLAPLLGNHRRRIELLNALLFALPGTPVIYYGDEIGMGDNIYLGDRNGVRTPMQWSSDRNAGFSRANPQQLYLPIIIDPEYHYEAINVEAQQNNPHSLLWWMRRIIALRKRYKAFGRGTLEFLHPDNRKVLVFIRRYEQETILVVANLSRFAQGVELDLSAFKGMLPVEMFGRTPFPPIGDLPYFLTLSPHAFHWFALEPQHSDGMGTTSAHSPFPILTISGSWDTIIRSAAKADLEALLPGYIKGRRWFGGKSRAIQSVAITEAVALPQQDTLAYITMIRVQYTEGDPQTYILPLSYTSGERATRVRDETPQAVIALLKIRGQPEAGLLYDAMWDSSFALLPLEAIARHRTFRNAPETGDITGSSTRAFRTLLGSAALTDLEPSLVRSEQSNTSMIYGDRFILKLFRRPEEGINPDLEIGRYLTEKRNFPNIPPVAGALEYHKGHSEPLTLAILQGFVRNEGDAWRYTLDSLSRYFESVMSSSTDKEVPLPEKPLFHLIDEEPPALAREMIDHYLESARLLGVRTAELHQALTGDAHEPNFAPETFSTMYQRSLYQSMRSQAIRVFQTLHKSLNSLPAAAQEDARKLLALEHSILDRFQELIKIKITGLRIRCHGDYHLGQVLYTGNDFMIIDFEGEPARSLSERRRKRSPLTDVAGMVRSFHYAAYTALFQEVAQGIVRDDHITHMEQWSRFWYLWVSATFLKSYLETSSTSHVIPKSSEEIHTLLNAYLMDKAIYELGYELNNRPAWVRIPIWGILQLVG